MIIEQRRAAAFCLRVDRSHCVNFIFDSFSSVFLYGVPRIGKKDHLVWIGPFLGVLWMEKIISLRFDDVGLR